MQLSPWVTPASIWGSSLRTQSVARSCPTQETPPSTAPGRATRPLGHRAPLALGSEGRERRFSKRRPETSSLSWELV